MFLKIKKRVYELMDTISEMMGVLHRLSDPSSAVWDCLDACESFFLQLNQEEVIPQKTIEQLQSVQASLNGFINGCIIINEKSIEMVNDKILLLKEIFKEEIKVKLNVVFFPYKASMWDSLETVYEVAAKDDNCVVNVVPIPYYQLSQNRAIPTYEGENFPANVPITHYNEYNLEVEQPDIIFVHNIYDQYNTITQVDEHFFTSNLKKYTDMLVYVPYHISSFIPPKKGDSCLAYSIPTIKNVDKIILAGEYLKNSAIKEGIPEEKLLAFGSPKIDAIVKSMKNDVVYPSGWKEKLEGKTVYVLNTGCMFFANQPFLKIGALSNILNITNIEKNNVLIWRPHPLTKISIEKYTPELLSYYNTLTKEYIKSEVGIYNNIILDETDDYLPALMAADVLISSEGSLLRSFLLTEKKVLYLDKELPKNSLVPPNAFYYFYNKDEPWYELVKKFAKGYDPLAENRKGIAAKAYANIDGTCGEKVYQVIKESVLK